jgi:hypothetical protein
MFSDPQIVTINSVAKSMPRISSSGTSAVYSNADGSYTLSISHTKTGKDRIRSLTRLDYKKVVADPLTSVNDYEVLSNYEVIDRPAFGFTLTEVQQQLAGFHAWLDATAIGKLFGQES